MEAHWLAGVFMHPIAIAFLVAIVSLSSFLLYSRRITQPLITKRQLAFGYLGVIVACLVLALSTYVSPQEALNRWHVPAEHYWNVLLTEFVLLATLLIYTSLLGVALIGAPVVFALARFGFANVPCVLAASVVISLLAAFLLSHLATPYSWSEDFMRSAPHLVGGHLALALGFCIGARLPWRLQARSHHGA